MEGNNTEGGKGKYRGKSTSPNGTPSTAKPTWTDLGLTPGFCSEKPETSRLKHSVEQCDYVTAEARSAAQHNAVFVKTFHG